MKTLIIILLSLLSIASLIEMLENDRRKNEASNMIESILKTNDQGEISAADLRAVLHKINGE